MTLHGVGSMRLADAGIAQAVTAEAPANEVSPVPSRVVVSAADDILRPGQLLGGTYEIRAKIGEGGMGQVYEAHDRGLRRQVAIKVARPGTGTTVVNEARALAAIRHPSTVAVFALGVDRGLEYVVMERLYGETLEAHLERRSARLDSLSVAEVVRILAGIAEGLAVVHGAGMAHRDVKPANVMLAPNDRIVLTDFGVFMPEIDVRRAFGCAGSPHYMAPELIAGRVARGELYLVDIYALGVVAFELLTGAVPYDDSDAMHVLWKHVSAPVPEVTEHRRGVPRALSALVQQMLSKDPEARPQNANEVAWRLRGIR